MAYALQYTRDTLVKLIMRTVGGLNLGVSPGETQEDEIERVLNMSVKSFDSAGWCRQATGQEASGAIAANAYQITAEAAAHSILGCHYIIDNDGTSHNVEIVSPKECFSHGPIYARGIPSHGCFIKPSSSAGTLYLNRRVPVAGDLLYSFRTSLVVIDGDTVKFISTGLGEEFLMACVLMSALAVAPAYGQGPGEMQEMRAQLSMHLDMLKSGQQLMHPGTVATLTGQVMPTPTDVKRSNM